MSAIASSESPRVVVEALCDDCYRIVPLTMTNDGAIPGEHPCAPRPRPLPLNLIIEEIERSVP